MLHCSILILKMSEDTSRSQAMMSGNGGQTARKVTSSRDRLLQPQDTQAGSKFSVSGLLKWRVNREASLAEKKAKLKTQQLLVEKQQSLSDEVRAETETIKAEHQAMERDVASQLDNLASLQRETGKSKLQLNQIHKMQAGMASFSGNVEFLRQRQHSSQDQLAAQLAELRLKHRTDTKAAQEARQKEREDFEN